MFEQLGPEGLKKYKKTKMYYVIPVIKLVSSTLLFQVSNSETYRKRARCKSECPSLTLYNHSKYTVHGKGATFIFKKCTQML